MPATCQLETVPDPEPPSPADLPEPPASWGAAEPDLRVWVQQLAAAVVQYGLQQRERGDVLEARYVATCLAIEAQK